MAVGASLIGPVLVGVSPVRGISGSASNRPPAGIWGRPTEIRGVPGGLGPLNGVSCVAPGECTAVGTDGHSEPFFVRERGGTWRRPTEVPNHRGSAEFYAVSCARAAACTAVGADRRGPLVASEVRGVWHAPVEIGLHGKFGLLEGVSCSAAGWCVAIGTDDNDGHSFPIYVTQSDGKWGPATAFPHAPFNRLVAVSCVRVGQCTAAGSNEQGNEQPSVVSETSGSWESAQVLRGAPGQFGRLQGISCATTRDCVTVGFDGKFQLVVATETGGKWGPVIELTTPEGINQVGGVSCPAAAACTAVGSQQNTFDPLVVSMSHGRWGKPTTFAHTRGGGGQLNAVSCAAASQCTAVGFDGDHQPFYISERPRPRN